MKKNKILITGNEACGEGAIRGGCAFYAGYPITPQNELIAYMSRRMEEENRVFIQAESELAAINMLFGASATGARCMTSSSSPGISLKQEGISYLAGAELPAVIVNIVRGGPGLGNIAPSQSDYFQATRGGGHGDYRTIVLVPATVQEMFDFTVKAFDLADKYRMPVMLLSDGMLGQLMEPLELDKDIVPGRSFDKSWALTGAAGREAGSIQSLYLKEGALEELNVRLQERYRKIAEEEADSEQYRTEGARIVLVAYGTTSRLCRQAVDEMRREGLEVGLFRLKTAWPFPEKEIKTLVSPETKFLAVEMSEGQMVEDVRLASNGESEVHLLGRSGGGVPEISEIIEKSKKIMGLAYD